MADGRRQDDPAADTGRIASLDGIVDGAGGAEPTSAPIARLGGLLGAESPVRTTGRPGPASPTDPDTPADPDSLADSDTPAGPDSPVGPGSPADPESSAGASGSTDQVEPWPGGPVARGGGAEPDVAVGRAGGVDLGRLDPTEARPASPVAAFAEDVHGGAQAAGPVALFDTDGLGAGRADVTVAELGPGAVRRRRSAQGGSQSDGSRSDRSRSDGSRSDGGRAPEDRSPGGSRRARRGGPDGGASAGRRDGPGARKGRPADPAVAVPDAAEPTERGHPAANDQPDDQRDDQPDDQAERRGRGRSGARRGAARRAGGVEELDPEADPVAVAREVCLRLLADRARTRQELAQALRRKGVPDDAANSVLERFDEVGLIDDAAFAGQWVRSRHTQRGLARRAIAVELRRKGVSDEDAGEALAEVDADSEERRARELVDRKLRSVAAGTPEKRAAAGRRLVGMLARKGYGPGVAYRVVKEALAERGAETDELGDGEVPED